MTEATHHGAGRRQRPTLLRRPPTTGSAGLVHRPGRWIDGWNPEDHAQWEGAAARSPRAT